jgi:hypothetical protein
MLLAGVAVATTTAILPASAAHAEVCTNWSRVASWGKASGTNCTFDNAIVQVTGTVTDTASDGYCVYVHVTWAVSPPAQDSRRACPNGTKISFGPLAGQGNTEISLQRLKV